MTLGRTIGLPQSNADATISELTGSFAQAVETVRLPALAAEAEAAATAQSQILAIVGERCTALAGDAGSRLCLGVTCSSAISAGAHLALCVSTELAGDSVGERVPVDRIRSALGAADAPENLIGHALCRLRRRLPFIFLHKNLESALPPAHVRRYVLAPIVGRRRVQADATNAR